MEVNKHRGGEGSVRVRVKVIWRRKIGFVRAIERRREIGRIKTSLTMLFSIVN